MSSRLQGVVVCHIETECVRRFLFPKLFNHHYCDWQEEKALKYGARGKRREDSEYAHFVIQLFTGRFDKQSKVSLQTHKSSQIRLGTFMEPHIQESRKTEADGKWDSLVKTCVLHRNCAMRYYL